MRLNLHGYRRQVGTGFSSPNAVHGLHRSGLMPVIVRTAEELKALDVKTQGVIIGHVGMKRKLELLKLATEKKAAVLNVKDPAAFLKKVEEERKRRKETQTSRLQQKKQKQEELKKTAKAKEAEKEEPSSEEDKKKEQVKEAEKVLTKRE